MNNYPALPYPPMPEGAGKNIIKPSKTFNRQVCLCIAAILLFLVTYLFLLACSLAIAAVFAFIGIKILVGLSSFMGLMAGVAMIFSGLMLIFFVVKFLFKKTKTDHSDAIEINEDEQPQLFAFIRQLTREAMAPFPKHIYISADVNAGVFYNSSFWSMFFPVKKNLKIGLGLVNSINLSEFKAIMAHEFGHFSQRSMKFGSYVYNLNNIIHDMLYDNDSFGRVLNSFANGHSFFRLFAWINVKLIQGMQLVLKQVYIVVNKTYMSLSREMEFHADTMAAYISGSNHAINSLKRIEIGQLCFTSLLDYLNDQLAQNKRCQNFYQQHLEMIGYYAQSNNLKTDVSGLPVVTADTRVNSTNQVILHDKWSSHPSNDDREAALHVIGLNTPSISEPAWLLFNKPEQLQEQLTEEIYSGVKLKTDVAVIDLEQFKADFYSAIDQNSFSKVYKGFYDGRGITCFDVEEAIKDAVNDGPAFDELFSDINAGLPKATERMQQDMSILDSLISIRTDIKTFDYKGTKHHAREAVAISNAIDEERQQTLKQIEELDKNIFKYFYNRCKTSSDAGLLVAKYQKLFKYQDDAVTDYDLYNDTMQVFKNVYNNMTVENIHKTLNTVYKLEKKLKPRIQTIVADEETRYYMDEQQLKAADKYASSKWVYYYEPRYDNEAIGVFNAGVSAYISAVAKRNFEIKKDLLNFQHGLLND